LRVSKDARPMLMEILNKTIKQDIERIKEQLPAFQDGEKEGKRKRITIQPEDVTAEKLAAPIPVMPSGINEANVAVKCPPGFERELDALPLEDAAPGFKVSVSVRQV
jgi:hypothetical protein